MTDKWKCNLRENVYVTHSRECETRLRAFSRFNSTSLRQMFDAWLNSLICTVANFSLPVPRTSSGRADCAFLTKFHLEEAEILVRWQIELSPSSSVRDVQNLLQ